MPIRKNLFPQTKVVTTYRVVPSRQFLQYHKQMRAGCAINTTYYESVMEVINENYEFVTKLFHEDDNMTEYLVFRKVTEIPIESNPTSVEL